MTAAACGGDTKEDRRGSAPRPDRSVEFFASDGVRLRGRLFGGGPTAVVLSHMGRPGDSMDDWLPLAQRLARDGHRVLVYNRRGVCSADTARCSGGIDDLSESWHDVVGAYRTVRKLGSNRVILVGASIGAMNSLRAAARTDVRVAGLIEVAGINNASGYAFGRAELRRIEGAKLFVSARGDVYGGAAAARQWHDWARPPKRILILPGDRHGTDILSEQGPAATGLVRALRTFIAGVARRR